MKDQLEKKSKIKEKVEEMEDCADTEAGCDATK
jgi:hypothetical protein